MRRFLRVLGFSTALLAAVVAFCAWFVFWIHEAVRTNRNVLLVMDLIPILAIFIIAGYIGDVGKK